MLQPHISYTGPVGRRVKGFKKAVKEAMTHSVVFWHRTYLARHFTPRAFSLYRGAYRSRSPRYQRRKQARWGHNNPLVWSGQTRAQATASIRVTGTAKQVRGKISGAGALNFGGSERRGELIVTNQQEANRMAKRVAEETAEFLNQATPVEKRRI